MKLTEQIDVDLIAAMKARDEVAKLTLRGIKKEIIEAKTAPGANGEISDEAVVKILVKMQKQRKESAEIYAQQSRADLAENELAEVAVIEKYLPKQISPEELELAIKSIIAKIGAQSPKDMGKVMGIAGKELAGRAEGRAISEIVKRCLNS
jgi:uncharacterized protein YqeY